MLIAIYVNCENASPSLLLPLNTSTKSNTVLTYFAYWPLYAEEGIFKGI